MNREIIFTLQLENKKIDISVDPIITINDFLHILFKKLGIKDGDKQLYSLNHKKILNADSTFLKEMIWDGDTLLVVR